MTVPLTTADAETFERCIGVGGIALFPSDTVYGLACDPGMDDAVERLDALRGRRPQDPAAVLFFQRDLAIAALPQLGERTGAALEALLPGAVTVLLPNPARRFAPPGGRDAATLHLRVPALPPSCAALQAVRWPVLLRGANRAGGPDARLLADVPEPIRREVDLVLDGGELPGTPSTVVDLRAFERTRDWAVVREGAVPREDIRARIADL